jgi:hypothetical protein
MQCLSTDLVLNKLRWLFSLVLSLALTPMMSHGENRISKSKNAGITQGDIFPVQVQEVFDPEGMPEKSESIEFWAFKFNSDFSKGELLVIVQAEVMGQKYPLYHLYPFSDVIRGVDTLQVSVKQPLAEAPRVITINLAQDKSIASVSGTLTTRSVLSSTIIKKTFKNISDKDFKLHIDKPNLK